MRFNHAALLIGDQLIACRAVSKGWKIINPRQLPNDKGRSVCVFLGGASVTGTRAKLPAAREGEIKRAAPFAVEDELASDISENHFAIGPKLDGTVERDIRVISNAEMQTITEMLEHHGLKNAPLYCAPDALPEGSMIEAGPFIYGRVNNRTFCLDADLPADVFIAMAQGVDELKIYGSRLAARLGFAPAGDGVATHEDLLLFLSEMQPASGAVNLRQGAFSIKHTVSKQQLMNWRRTAALVALAGGLWFATLIGGTRALEARAENVNAAMTRILSSEFPEADGNYDLVLGLYQNAGDASNQPLPSVVDVTALLYKAVSEVDRAQIRSFRYDAQRREAICVVAADDFAALEVFSEALRKGGLNVSGGDARQDRNGVVGEFKLGAS